MIELITIKCVNKEILQLRKILKDIASEAYIFGSLVSSSAIKNESDVDLLIVPKVKIDLKQGYSLLDHTVENFLDKGLVLHIILYDPKRHPKDLLEAARRGLKLI